MITKTIAMNAEYRQEFMHRTLLDSRKKPVVCRVNGACRTWKTRPTEFQLPVKHGLKQCFYITVMRMPKTGKVTRTTISS